jgi:hypothetical protein
VECSRGDEQHLTGLDRQWRLAVELIFQLAFDDIDDFFTRMRVPWGDQARGELDEHLVHLASGDAEIVPLEIGALGAPSCCADTAVSAKAFPTISSATAMARIVFMWNSFPRSICVSERAVIWQSDQ